MEKNNIEIYDILTLFANSNLKALKYNDGNHFLEVRRDDSNISINGDGKNIKELNKPVSEFLDKNSGTENDKHHQTDEIIKVIKSPTVGIFYSRASPKNKDFISIGGQVHKGDVVGIIEVMKTMSEIKSPYDGIVEKVLVSNEEVVEYDSQLFVLK